MTGFTGSLRQRVSEAQRAVTRAWRTGNDERARLHAGDLADLLEMAARHGVDTTGWVHPAVRSFTEQWS